MGKRIIFLPEAEADLDEAAEFYEIQEPGLGDEVFDFLSARIDELVTTGGLHSFSRGAHRAVVLGRFPYFTIYYRTIHQPSRCSLFWTNGAIQNTISTSYVAGFNFHRHQ